jgi:pimeloyl-ACP methyl ester carboxylesterase
MLRAYDSAGAGSGGLALVWHHGSPQTGAPLAPLLAAARERGIRLVSYGRPSYGGSSPHPGRDVASAARDVEQVLDALGVETFATMGASGGGPHALACAALLAGRVTGVVCLAGLAPYDGRGEWFAGMRSDGALRAAVAGRATRERHEETATFDEDQFTAADWAALSATWTSLGEDAGRAGSEGPAGLIDDDLAFVGTWGFDLAAVTAPALFVHGGEDRVVPLAHSEWLLRACPQSELWLRPRDGHVSVLDACPVAMDWLLAAARG